MYEYVSSLERRLDHRTFGGLRCRELVLRSGESERKCSRPLAGTLFLLSAALFASFNTIGGASSNLSGGGPGGGRGECRGGGTEGGRGECSVRGGGAPLAVVAFWAVSWADAAVVEDVPGVAPASGNGL